MEDFPTPADPAVTILNEGCPAIVRKKPFNYRPPDQKSIVYAVKPSLPLRTVLHFPHAILQRPRVHLAILPPEPLLKRFPESKEENNRNRRQ
jgi:hypothetical protein